MSTCEICGKPQSPYPNWIVSHGHEFHLGCLADAFDELRLAHAVLLQRLLTQGTWGPWCDDWEGTFDQKHWGEELYDDRAAKEASKRKP